MHIEENALFLSWTKLNPVESVIFILWHAFLLNMKCFKFFLLNFCNVHWPIYIQSFHFLKLLTFPSELKIVKKKKTWFDYHITSYQYYWTWNMKMDNNLLDECLDVRRLTEDLWNIYLLQNDGTSVYVDLIAVVTSLKWLWAILKALLITNGTKEWKGKRRISFYVKKKHELVETSVFRSLPVYFLLLVESLHPLQIFQKLFLEIPAMANI